MCHPRVSPHSCLFPPPRTADARLPPHLESAVFAWDAPGDSLRDLIAAIAANGHAGDRWGCGGTTAIRAGDRPFLMRLETEPRGIVGSGVALGATYLAPHWQRPGAVARYVDLRFDGLRDASREPILTAAFLRDDPRFAAMRAWHPRVSGARIPTDAARALEEAWANLRATPPRPTH